MLTDGCLMAKWGILTARPRGTRPPKIMYDMYVRVALRFFDPGAQPVLVQYKPGEHFWSK